MCSVSVSGNKLNSNLENMTRSVVKCIGRKEDFEVLLGENSGGVRRV